MAKPPAPLAKSPKKEYNNSKIKNLFIKSQAWEELKMPLGAEGERKMNLFSIQKPKIYLDTSVISYLEQEDAPEKMAETREFWDLVKQGKFDVFISDTEIREIEQCTLPKRKLLQQHLLEIEYHFIESNEQCFDLADKIIDYDILKQKSLDDCRHIAAAMVANCDIIVSWNFKHIVNYRTIKGIKMIATAQGYKDILIYPPSVVLDYEKEK